MKLRRLSSTQHASRFVAILIVLTAVGFAFAQFEPEPTRILDRGGVPTWTNDPDFESDAFTFARVKYQYQPGSRGRWAQRRGEGWETDYPDSELNFSYRLQQLTSLVVSPDPSVVELTDKRLFDHPLIYIVEPTELLFDEDEADALRKYLLNGGFLLIADLWGDQQWDGIWRELEKVFPDRNWIELTLEHEIFHCVYDIKEVPQVPSIHAAQRGRAQGITWQGGEDARIPSFRAIHDDHGRIVVLVCHNNDIGDGWEREGEDEWYFREFSEKKSYPMGINIIVYALTH